MDSDCSPLLLEAVVALEALSLKGKRHHAMRPCVDKVKALARSTKALRPLASRILAATGRGDEVAVLALNETSYLHRNSGAEQSRRSNTDSQHEQHGETQTKAKVLSATPFEPVKAKPTASSVTAMPVIVPSAASIAETVAAAASASLPEKKPQEARPVPLTKLPSLVWSESADEAFARQLQEAEQKSVSPSSSSLAARPKLPRGTSGDEEMARRLQMEMEQEAGGETDRHAVPSMPPSFSQPPSLASLRSSNPPPPAYSNAL